MSMKHSHQTKPMTLIEYIRYKKDVKKAKKIKQFLKNEEPEGIVIKTLAVVKNGSVHEIIRAQDLFAQILLSGPSFVEINENTRYPQIGWLYNDGKFMTSEEAVKIYNEKEAGENNG